MSDEPRFRPDLYQGTAEFYERFRPPYPQSMLADLVRRAGCGGGKARLLDLACGTGQILFPLASRFANVVAVDQEVEAIALAERKAVALGLDHLDLIAAPAEAVVLDGAFELVTIGNAFHRLDRRRTAERMTQWLQPGGCVALLWAPTPWRGERAWQRELAGTLRAWQQTLGAQERVPRNWSRAVERDPHVEVLRRAGLELEGRFEFTERLTWTPASIAGFVYSTSFLNRSVLGDRVDAFENDLRDRLASVDAQGTFHQDAVFAYDLARAPRLRRRRTVAMGGAAA